MPDLPRIHVAKFGGTSVATPERMRRVVDLVMEDAREGPEMRRVVVTSALGGVTDRLLGALRLAEAHDGGYRDVLQEVARRHEDALRDLVPADEQPAVRERLEALWREIGELLTGVYLLRQCTPRFSDAIVSAGERASVPLLAAAFRAAGHDAAGIEATAVVRTDDRFGEAAVDFETTDRLVQEHFAALFAERPGVVPVVTGFLGATPRGATTTLGRSGSDYTATILGGALHAEAVTIWTDVDGVLSADPRIVPDAFSLGRLAYEEAAELAYFGAKVLHPRTMRPLQAKGIPLVIKNTLNPGAAGTVIGPRAGDGGAGRIKAVTAVRDVALVTLDGAGVLGAPDLTARAFSALAEAGVSVVFIAQASSEQSLCLAVRDADREQTVAVLKRIFGRDLERGDVRAVRAEGGAAVVAAVGDQMKYQPGLAGRLFATLGRARVNVLAIAQAASETNVSAAVADADAVAAIGALHEAFALGRTRAHVAVVGAGTLGRKLLALLAGRQPHLLAEASLNLRLVGLARTERLLWDVGGLGPATAAEQLETGEEAGLDALIERLTTAHIERPILVDVTASDVVARRTPELLRAGVAVVTPNKSALSGDAALYAACAAASRDGRAPFLYETTVGAGLGILPTLRDARRTGDRIRRVEGVLSGTLAFVMNALRAGTPFSEAVFEAHRLGYTEPDPRADLSGADVARKLVILAREAGRPATTDEVAAESLVPPDYAALPTADFLRRLPELDAAWKERVAAAAAAGHELHYVACLDADGLRASVEPVRPGSPLAGLTGPAYVVLLHTDRYGAQPRVVAGPGASADVTAAVLLADLVHAAAVL